MRAWIRWVVVLGLAAAGCAAEAGNGAGYDFDAFAPSDVPVTPAPSAGTAGTGGGATDPFATIPPPTTTDTTVGAPVVASPMMEPPTTPSTDAPPVAEPPAIDDPPVEPPAAPPTDSVGVPAGAYCAPVADWDPLWLQFEEEVLVLVNENRAAGANCGGEEYPPAPPLAMQESLVCSARLHSMDMAVQDYFSHTSLDGRTPQNRIGAAGYAGSWYGENIAWGQRSPEEVMAGWMDSPGHCSNIMNANFTEIGIGYYQGASDPSAPVWQQAAPYWTQNFGSPGRW